MGRLVLIEHVCERNTCTNKGYLYILYGSEDTRAQDKCEVKSLLSCICDLHDLCTDSEDKFYV